MKHNDSYLGTHFIFFSRSVVTGSDWTLNSIFREIFFHFPEKLSSSQPQNGLRTPTFFDYFQ